VQLPSIRWTHENINFGRVTPTEIDECKTHLQQQNRPEQTCDDIYRNIEMQSFILFLQNPFYLPNKMVRDYAALMADTVNHANQLGLNLRLLLQLTRRIGEFLKFRLQSSHAEASSLKLESTSKVINFALSELSIFLELNEDLIENYLVAETYFNLTVFMKQQGHSEKAAKYQRLLEEDGLRGMALFNDAKENFFSIEWQSRSSTALFQLIDSQYWLNPSLTRGEEFSPLLDINPPPSLPSLESLEQIRQTTPQLIELYGALKVKGERSDEDFNNYFEVMYDIHKAHLNELQTCTAVICQHGNLDILFRRTRALNPGINKSLLPLYIHEENPFH
jgi:hypothetical protein